MQVIADRVSLGGVNAGNKSQIGEGIRGRELGVPKTVLSRNSAIKRSQEIVGRGMQSVWRGI